MGPGPGYGRSVEEESARAPPPWAGTLKRVSQSTNVGGPRTASFYQNNPNAQAPASGEQRKVPPPVLSAYAIRLTVYYYITITHHNKSAD